MLIKKVSVKLPCVDERLSSGDLFIFFGKIFLFLFLVFFYNIVPQFDIGDSKRWLA